jgi:hypothetical protein
MDTTAFHAYRIVQSGSLADLYVDGVRALSNVAPTTATSGNTIFFGQDQSAAIGKTEWDYFRWTNAGAFIPEPSAMGLTVMAMLGWGAWRRRA